MKKKEKEVIDFLKDINKSIKKAEPFQLPYEGGWCKKILIILTEDGFNNIDIILNLIEKNKELEKGNRSLMESRIKWKNRYYKEKAKNKKDNIQVVYGGRRFGTEGMVVKEYISKDKIKNYEIINGELNDNKRT